MADINSSFLEIPIWPGSGSNPSGSTPFGYFDNDLQFQAHAPKVADYCAKKMGYPIQNIEMTDTQFYACFEEAVLEYGAQVNQFNIRENLFLSQGAVNVTGSDLSGKNITPNLGRLIQLAKNYGQEVGVGGHIDWKRGRLDVVPYQQLYNLDTEAIMPCTSGSVTGSDNGSPVEIKRVFHMESQLMSQFVGTTDYGQSSISYDTQLLLDTFGWGNMAVGGASFLLTPLSYDLMRMQAIEFNQQIRRSTYSFELRNNKITILPIPQYNFRIYFDYILISDRDNLFSQYGSGSEASLSGSLGTGYVSDYSNIPYNAIQYTSINDVGRQWILRYSLACTKETLGLIRSTYQSIPSPTDGDITLNGADLVSQAQQEKEALITQLRENLDQVSRRMQLERQKDEIAFTQESLDKMPLKIYIR